VFEGLENRKNVAVPNYYNAENLAIKNKTQFQNPVMKISITPLHKIYNYILI